MPSSAMSVCHSSIHSFLSDIPCQASELAVNVVNNYIEDQVADHKNLVKNISRVKSVFRKCSHGICPGEGGGGDCAIPERKLLLTLPRKIRQKIWRHVDDNTVKTLRLVCQQLRHEMDYEVGLSITLSTDSFNSLWMKSISIRSCYLKRMENIFILNTMARPEKLEKLTVDSELYVDADIAELFIRKFRNLRQLTLYTEDIMEIKNEYDEALSNGISAALMSRLEDSFQLTSVDVKFDTAKWKLKWNIKIKQQNCGKYWKIKDVIRDFGETGITHVPSRDLSQKSLQVATLSIPFVQDRDRLIWIRVLASQHNLTSLTCDLNATHWKEYEVIVQSNRVTLRKLFLLNITSVKQNQQSTTELPLNWAMFEECNALQEITLIADTFIRRTEGSKARNFMDTENLTLLQCPKLRALWLENFKFSPEDSAFFKRNPLTPDTPRFELCTLKHCKIGDEQVSEVQFGIKRRNRSLECLCFGSVSYSDDELDKLEKASIEASNSANACYENELSEFDMIDYLQFSQSYPNMEEESTVLKYGKLVASNFDLISGLALTTWLWMCK